MDNPGKKDKDARLDKQSAGKPGHGKARAAKGGAGHGKGNWGAPGVEQDIPKIDKGDPNYDSSEEQN